MKYDELGGHYNIFRYCLIDRKKNIFGFFWVQVPMSFDFFVAQECGPPVVDSQVPEANSEFAECLAYHSWNRQVI